MSEAGRGLAESGVATRRTLYSEALGYTATVVRKPKPWTILAGGSYIGFDVCDPSTDTTSQHLSQPPVAGLVEHMKDDVCATRRKREYPAQGIGEAAGRWAVEGPPFGWGECDDSNARLPIDHLRLP